MAVAADGTSYVGFAGVAGLVVLAADGTPAGSIALGAPVTALDVDPGGDVWADDGSTVTRLSPAGAVRGSFPHRPAASCSADAGRYGGIDVTGSLVYVAERCRGTVGVYGRSGTLKATVDLPGSASPRGIAWAPAFRKVPARLYVSVPDAGKVYGYDAAGLNGRSKPVVTVTRSRPGGLAADDHGHLAVLDSASNGLYLYDAATKYSLYRTLGHPPTAATTKGYLSRPADVAQGGAKVGRQFWVADTGNGRVQRWTVGGTTRWMADTKPPSAPGTPSNAEAPTVSGDPVVGAELSCSTGAWTGAPTSYAQTWLRDDEPIAGATGATYVVTAEDLGTELSCVVTATNAVGDSAPATSEPVAVGDGVPTGPVTTCRGGPSVRIERSGKVVAKPFVTLRIRAPEGADEVEISNDGFRHFDRKPLVSGCRYPWTLDGGPSARPKVVSVRFPGVAGVVKDHVLLDGAAPVIHQVTAKWITARQGWVLRIRATDRGTGIAFARVGKTRSSTKKFGWPADVVSWDSSQLRWIQVTDRAGLRSKWYRFRLG
ncbi:hypothetical protein GCM10023349_29350 [Nocardioides conyzicola]|uniref:Ig-like domain-containing protein n=1 Tax=Nocardioides conyzicola TaxID=1651781 RepID=A0ABP8XID8_9ACTN